MSSRVVIYQSIDPQEVDYRWLAVEFRNKAPRGMAAGPSEEIARSRLEKVLQPPVDDLV